ncbi:MAG: hypothetical protein IJT08_01340, partial [Alphaproteobacteria bacterium]|nr:hypothetical protein [Alphaproteobacteria bacterium]
LSNVLINRYYFQNRKPLPHFIIPTPPRQEISKDESKQSRKRGLCALRRRHKFGRSMNVI